MPCGWLVDLTMLSGDAPVWERCGLMRAGAAPAIGCVSLPMVCRSASAAMMPDPRRER